MVHVPLMCLSEWREFPSAPCRAGKKKNLMTVRVSILLKSRASPDMLPFNLCNKKKTCNSAYEQAPLSNDTIDSVLRYREACSFSINGQVDIKCYTAPSNCLEIMYLLTVSVCNIFSLLYDL